MYRDLYVFCWYVCRLFVMNYGAVSTNQEDPFCFQRILLFLTRAQKNIINKILQAQGCDIHRCLKWTVLKWFTELAHPSHNNINLIFTASCFI